MRQFPTANTTEYFSLELYVGDDRIYGNTVRLLFLTLFEYLEKKSKLSDLPIPFKTSGENVLVNASPHHLDGRGFVASLEYISKENQAYYININHPRFFALRQAARVLEVVGLDAELPENSGGSFF